LFKKPFQDTRGIETTRVGKTHFSSACHFWRSVVSVTYSEEVLNVLFENFFWRASGVVM
jgi:hypothetical protein